MYVCMFNLGRVFTASTSIYSIVDNFSVREQKSFYEYLTSQIKICSYIVSCYQSIVSRDYLSDFMKLKGKKEELHQRAMH